MQKFYVDTFGCTANTSATELMIYKLQKCDYVQIDDISNADFVLINTCIVKAPTENKIKVMLKRMYSKKPLIVAGCLPQVLSDWCIENIPKAALIGVDHFGDICKAVKAIENREQFSLISRKKEFCSEINRKRNSKFTGIIEISKGCTGQCAYCIVKIAKGPLVSKTDGQILLEVKKALSEGCAEIWLTAQDTASYGEDIETNLIALLKKIVAIDGDFMIRIGMMNADYALEISSDLVEILQHPKIYSFLHIPLQAGSNAVLKKMKRKYTYEQYFNLIQKLREIPQLTLSTDIITGFPGETEDDFQQTVKAINQLKFDIVNISKYGDRQGTLSSKSTEKILTEIIKDRSRITTKLTSRIKTENNLKWEGWTGEALALRREQNDSITLLRNKAYKLIAVSDPSLVLGKKYEVTITKGLKTRLIGKLARQSVK